MKTFPHHKIHEKRASFDKEATMNTDGGHVLRKSDLLRHVIKAQIRASKGDTCETLLLSHRKDKQKQTYTGNIGRTDRFGRKLLTVEPTEPTQEDCQIHDNYYHHRHFLRFNIFLCTLRACVRRFPH